MLHQERAGPEGALTLDAGSEHSLRNHLSIIVGFCDLVLREMAASDPARTDLVEIQQAANAAVAVLTRARTQCEISGRS